MNDAEFDLIDELYFVSSFQELQHKLPDLDNQLGPLLSGLIAKGWVKCFLAGSDEEVSDLSKIDLNYNKYNYLATKAGLLAHNSK